MIPCADPRAQYLAHRDEIDAAIRRVLDGGRFILGDEVKAFESEFAAWCGVRHGVGVANATDALALTLRALGIGRGDEVVTVAHTAVATVAAIEMAGAEPVLVDVDPRTCTMDPARLAAAIGPRVQAIIPVHLYGQPCDLAPILEVARARGIRVIEDCSQAHGAEYGGRRVGAWGDAGCFSFYPTKNLGAIGDGGLVVTGDAELAARLRRLREYGWDERRESLAPGVNTRLDEVQAAILRAKLRHLDADTAGRQRIAARYDAAFAAYAGFAPQRRVGARHVFHLYVVRTPRRDALRERLAAQGIHSLVHYERPAHRHRAYAGRLRGADALPETERAAREVLSLPMFPELDDAAVERVARETAAFMAGAVLDAAR